MKKEIANLKKELARYKQQAGVANMESAEDSKDEINLDSESAKALLGQIASRSSSSTSTHANVSWYADLGATSHMMPHREWIRDMEPFFKFLVKHAI